MANIKISELTALTPPDAADLVPVTDASASQTKRTTVGEIVGIINGDVDVANDGTATISELPVSKLQDGAARQLLQTDAAGTGVEWTSNVDVPGTLDVTGATTLDSTLGVTGQSTLASAAVSDLTSGRVVLAGTSGELEDNAGLTFNGTQLDVDGDVVITGDLTVEGASTVLETQTLTVEDKNIELGVVASPTDVTADGGGITLKGTTDKTINWVDATDSWTSSEHIDLASGKSYRINGTEVLSGTTLGSGVTGSSLTSVGTLGSLIVTNNLQIGSSFAGFGNGSGIEIQRSATATLRLTGASGVGTEFYNTGTLASIQTRSSIPFTIQTNEQEHFRITATGDLYFTGAGTAGVTKAVSFSSSAPVDSLALDASGNLLIGTADSGSSSDSGVVFGNNGSAVWKADGTGDLNQLDFYRGTSGSYAQVGKIVTNSTGTSFTSVSDYRLKENVTAVADGIARLQQLKPSRFNFIADPDKTVDGFLAHEVQDVVPEAISGEKDAVDDEGKPIYQGIDQGKLVPLLTAALQEALAEIESLKARVTALEP